MEPSSSTARNPDADSVAKTPVNGGLNIPSRYVSRARARALVQVRVDFP